MHRASASFPGLSVNSLRQYATYVGFTRAVYIDSIFDGAALGGFALLLNKKRIEIVVITEVVPNRFER
jgi:hypothetical protein